MEIVSILITWKSNRQRKDTPEYTQRPINPLRFHAKKRCVRILFVYKVYKTGATVMCARTLKREQENCEGEGESPPHPSPLFLPSFFPRPSFHATKIETLTCFKLIAMETFVFVVAVVDVASAVVVVVVVVVVAPSSLQASFLAWHFPFPVRLSF